MILISFETNTKINFNRKSTGNNIRLIENILKFVLKIVCKHFVQILYYVLYCVEWLLKNFTGAPG